jgi:hypothetical protein
VSITEVAERIDAPAADVAYLLGEELARGRVRRTDAGHWQLVPGAFGDDVVAALRQLA